VGSFREWYERNKDKLNRRRRLRYRTDAEYRAKQLASTRRWRAEHAKKRARQPAPKKTLFSIGEAAAKLGCEQKTIRLLEKAKLIPGTSDGVHHRRYTAKQIKLIGRIIAFRKSVHYRDPKYQPRLKELSAHAFAEWGVK
jgi:hypothetical protein